MNEWNLLDRLLVFVKRFVVLPSSEHYKLLVLWIAHTYFTDRLTTTPRLALISPEYGCGKTRTLEVIGSLSFQAEQLSGYTKSYLMRQVTQVREEFGRSPTLCIDEVDTVWNGSKSDEGSEALRMFMNAGYRMGALIGITEGEGKNRKPTKFDTYAPIVFAGKGDRAPESVKTRSIEIRLQRRLASQEIEDFQTKVVELECEELVEHLESWRDLVSGELSFVNESLPFAIRDRERELWLPLYAVARVGNWEEEFAILLEFYTRQKKEQEEIPWNRQLLGDCVGVFEEAGNPESLKTQSLVVALNDLPDRDYKSLRYGKGLDGKTLAKKLKEYGIAPTQIRFGMETAKGYYLFPIRKVLENYSEEVSLHTPERETRETEETPEELF